MADVSRIRRSSHAGKTPPHGTAVARSEELPLLQREVRQLVEPDEQKLRALILVNVVFVAAVAEARGRAVVPRDDVLRLVVALVKLARNVAAEIGEQRRFELRIRAPQKQRIAAVDPGRLEDGLPEQRFRLARACRAAKETVLHARSVKLLLARERPIPILHAEGPARISM